MPTQEDLDKWLLNNYPKHIQESAINVDSLESALAEKFGGVPNPLLHEYVVDFCLDVHLILSERKK